MWALNLSTARMLLNCNFSIVFERQGCVHVSTIFAAFLGQTVFMIITAYMMTPTAAIVCLTFAVGIGGLAWAGFSVNMLDIAPQVWCGLFLMTISKLYQHMRYNTFLYLLFKYVWIVFCLNNPEEKILVVGVLWFRVQFNYLSVCRCRDGRIEYLCNHTGHHSSDVDRPHC